MDKPEKLETLSKQDHCLSCCRFSFDHYIFFELQKMTSYFLNEIVIYTTTSNTLKKAYGTVDIDQMKYNS